MRALIGSNGTVGSSLLDTMRFDAVFNRDNLHTLVERSWSEIIIAAPSGNRLAINRGESSDQADCEAIVHTLERTTCARTVLIGSVDAITAPNTPYGRNRLWLEENFAPSPERCVFRLATLIGSRIKKNLIFNLKHSLFLDNLDPDAELQWSILSDLAPRILASLNNPPTICNLVSVPVKNKLIIDSFRPDLSTSVHTASNIRYNLQPYTYSETDVLSAIQEYML